MPKSKRTRRSKNKSGYIGVTKNRGGDKYTATICFNRKPNHLGSSYATAKQAAKAYDKEAIKFGRPFSKLNFPKKAPVGYTPIQQPLLSRNTLGYRCVYKNRKKFTAQIQIDGKVKGLGSSYDTAKEAAIAYDRAVLKANQSTTLLNFPEMVHNLDVEPKRTKQNVNSTGLGFFRRNQIYDQASIAAAIFDCCIALRPSSNQEWQQISHSKFSR